MKKILYVSTLMSTINAFLVPHILALIEEGYTVDCAANYNVSSHKSLVEKGVKVHHLELHRTPYSIRNIQGFTQLLQLVKKQKYNIIHVHTPVAALITRLIKLFYPKIQIFYTAHGFHFHDRQSSWKKWGYLTIEKFLGKCTDSIITINQYDYNMALRHQFLSNSKRLYLLDGVGIDLNYYNRNQFNEEFQQQKRQEFNINLEDFVITMVAEFNATKRQADLVRAIQLLKTDYPSVYQKTRVLLIGTGTNLENIRQMIQNMQLDSHIYCVGRRTDVVELLYISNLQMLISEREGLPRSVMEAIAMNIPVLGTDVRGIRDLLIDHPEMLVQVGDSRGMAEKISKIFNQYNGNFDKTLEYYYAHNLIQNFSLDKVVDELMKIYSIVV